MTQYSPVNLSRLLTEEPVRAAPASQPRADSILHATLFGHRGAGTPPAVSLSPRELQILNFLAAGYSNLEIADRAFISKDTVKYHLKNMFNKLGVKNRFEALVAASHNGLLSVSADSD